MVGTWTVTLALAPVAAFRRRMHEDLARRLLMGGYPAFGVYGSRLELPRTESNERRSSPAPARRRRRPK